MSVTVAFHRSLLGRSMLLGALPASLVVLLIVGFNGVRAWHGFEATLEGDLRGAVELVGSEINAVNTQNLQRAQALAFAQESGMFGHRADTLALMEKIARANPDVHAAYVAYEPNADGADAAYGQAGEHAAVPAAALGAGGRFYPYFRRDARAATGFILEPLQDSENDGGLWYDYPKERFARAGDATPLITKPYDYFGQDIIENIAPIVIDGRFVGVAGIDLSLESMQQRLSNLATDLGADIFLEARGNFVAATTDAEGTARLRTTAVAQSDLAEIFAGVPSTGIHLEQRIDPRSGEMAYFVTTTIAAGEWHLVVRKSSSAVLASVSDLFMWNILTALVGIALLVVLLAALALGTSRRVRAAQQAAERMASGDLSQGITLMQGRDESAELVRAMGRMSGDLRLIVESVRSASTRLAASSVELAATSREQGATASTFGGSTAQIAAAIREISATGQQLLHTVVAVDASARRSAESATAGRTSLESMARSMHQLEHATGEVSDRLQVISEKADAITSVVVTMSKVAEQTNLLSVNAAIEAEKAGDAGLGFLVVSREIRRLADQTATATLDIERIVRGMQDAVTSGVGEMTRFTTEMRGSTLGVQRLTSSLGTIIGEMQTAARDFSMVQTGMAQQSAGVVQIDEGVRQVAEGARHTATSAAEFTRVADDLAHAVALLQDAVARFTLDAPTREGH